MSLLRDVIWELQLPDAMDPGIHGARTHWIRLPCMDLAVMVDLTREPSR